MDLHNSFKFAAVSGAAPAVAPVPNPLGVLALLAGKWKGHGFNQIWRPFHPGPGDPGGQDRFLELNFTNETLEFEEIPGDIPNRGLLQVDINLHGVRYLQQVQDANVKGPDGKLAGIHLKPGLWVTVPQTTDPVEPTTVVRMASIPHGTSLVAQGTSLPTISTAPPIDPISIAPFGIGSPPPPNTTITPPPFNERNLAVATKFRTDLHDVPGITQAIVDNPNSVLTAALHGQTVTSTTTLKISTIPLKPPTTGGGTSNIAFLQGGPGGPNAVAAQLDATFWIETIQGPGGKIIQQLQYSQRVLLNFNGLSWPHVSVATLIKQ